MQHLRFRAMTRVLRFLLAAPGLAVAQPMQPPSPAEATAALNPAPNGVTRQQLDQMLAPIALYTDELLAQLLMAATFPQQVIEARQWLQDPANAALKGDDLVGALQPLQWDPSVKSLVDFAQIIEMMTTHLDWTEAIGLAFANQQIETMARIQFLRQRAVASGELMTTPQVVVQQDEPEVIIEPADPNIVYVPFYNTAEVYGDWPDRDYPPVYVPPPEGYAGSWSGVGIGFGVGVGVVAPLWGWGHPDWRRHEIVINQSRYTNITNLTATTNNHIIIQNDTWHRTASMAPVPEPARPQPAANPAPHPPGTVAPTAVVLSKPAAALGGPSPSSSAAGAAVVHPASGPPPALHPSEPVVIQPPRGSPLVGAPTATHPPSGASPARKPPLKPGEH
jgi:hypothetical protein